MSDEILCQVDEDDEPDERLRAITNRVIGAYIAVHRQLGAGYGESIYQRALAIELRFRGVGFAEQVPVTICYRGEPVGEQRLDFLVEGSVIVEIKAVEQLSSLHVAQVVSYLRATEKPLGLLINFNVRLLKDGIRRIANTLSPSSPRPLRPPTL